MSNASRLVIRRDFPRPPREAIEALRGVGTSAACDAQDRTGALHAALRPLTRARRFVGPVLPVQAGPKDNLATYAALAVARPGDVVLITNGAYDACAAVGGIWMGMAANAGIAGCVTDGAARDLAELEATGVPVFAAGTSPNSPFKNGPGAVGLPISLGEVAVAPGDVALADEDGVVVVPLATLDRFLEAVADVQRREAEMSAWVADGMTAPPWLEGLLASPAVEWR